MAFSKNCAIVAGCLSILMVCIPLVIFLSQPAATTPEVFSQNMLGIANGLVYMVYAFIGASVFAALTKLTDGVI